MKFTIHRDLMWKPKWEKATKHFFIKLVRNNLQQTLICNNICKNQPIEETNSLIENQLILWAQTHKFVFTGTNL
jgi:hypothetical protein